jgi:hypothetical protein
VSNTWRWAVKDYDPTSDLTRWRTVDPASFRSTGYSGNPSLVRGDVEFYDPMGDDDGVIVSAGDGEYTPYRDAKSARLVAAAPELEALARDLAVALASWEEWAARVRINDGPRYHDTISALVRARALGVFP